MDFRKRIFLITINAIVFCAGSARADMVQMSAQQAGQEEYCCIVQQTSVEQKEIAGSYDNPVSSIINFDFMTIRVASEASMSAEQKINPESSSLELKSEQGSLSLCLYALMSFGLCSAPHWLKRLSFGPVPDWYHSGGPHQVGHSFAAPPDFHRIAPVLHFIQPDNIKENSIPRYRTAILISLWRESQFTPEKTASRAPPFIA
jgi:hypothetical protein